MSKMIATAVTRTEIRPVHFPKGIQPVLDDLAQVMQTIPTGGELHLAFQPESDGGWTVQGVIVRPAPQTVPVQPEHMPEDDDVVVEAEPA